MKNTKVTLVPLTEDDREQFILDNQWAFKYGAIEEFGKRDDHVDFDGEIISRKTIERCIDSPDSETYRIVLDGRKVGGVILKIDKETHHNELEILFVPPRSTPRASATAHGLRWRPCTPKPRFGRPAHRILRSEISIFTSTNADFRLISFGVNIYSPTTKCLMKTNVIPTRDRTRCFVS